MRPKIVLFLLLIAASTLTLVGLLSGRLHQPRPESPLTTETSNSVAGTNPQPRTPLEAKLQPPADQPGGTNVIATTQAEDVAAQKEKDLDAIRDALVTGNDDPAATLQAIASRLENNDEEVRAAARVAATQVGDTNMIPYLTSASDHLKDPREKAAIFEAIAYLQLSSSVTNSDDAMLMTNMTTKRFRNPNK